ncbi:MAG: M1 family metallopeptidase [Flavobacterium sp.]
MNKSALSIFLFLILFNITLQGQTSLPIATNSRNAYKNETRDVSGSPGKAYWQNNADYRINVKFDPESGFVSGSVSIDYKNNSPDTLKKIVFKLYPNFFQSQAMRNSAVDAADLTSGVDIKSIKMDGVVFDSKKLKINGTNMYLRETKVTPKSSTHFDVDFAYKLNKGSFNRTGQVDSGAFVIAYFFPRIAVYDDVEGWNEYPYLGKEEFYNDYCNFKVDIEIPGNYQCWATGDLKNPESVYNDKFVKRIDLASETDQFTDIITESDIQQGNITKQNPVNIWKFEAENVTDFAFAISNHYIWKSSSLIVDPKTNRRTRVDAVFNPEHKDYLPVVEYARKTVDLMSYQMPAVAFPYSHQTIFEGLDAMEYPMLVNNLPFEGKQAVQLTVHEIFHAMFPFYVGSNETKFSFLDEGWATYAEITLSGIIDEELKGSYDMSDINTTAGSDQDVPIMTLTPQLYGKARFSNKDLKPAIGFYYLNEMLGEELFLKGIRYYIDQWKGKHPTPNDFFSCMNKGTRIDLNWFWKNWFYEKHIPDLGITSVNISKRKIEVTNIGGSFVPIHLTISYRDGHKKELSKNIDCWSKGNKIVSFFLSDISEVNKIELGKPYDVDTDTTNNEWIRNKLN